MQLTNLLVATLFAASSAVAAPAPADVSMMAADPEWIIQSLKRTCNTANTECTWSFSVNTQIAAATNCNYVVKGANASKNKAAPPAACGPYTVSSGWSDQFGPGNEFTTISIANHAKKLIVWGGYTDKEVAGGKVVSPNKKYAPAKF
jgi:hypothetical protein